MIAAEQIPSVFRRLTSGVVVNVWPSKQKWENKQTKKPNTLICNICYLYGVNTATMADVKI